MSNQQEFVLTVIGAGPRGTSFLERLLAHLENNDGVASAAQLRVLVVDPAPHGPGRVWNPDQSDLYLMNTPASFPTAAPVGSTQEQLRPSSVSRSFAQWRGDAETTDYPARRDYGSYLTWLHEAVVQQLRNRSVVVDPIFSYATGLHRVAGGYQLQLQNGARHEVHAAVLCLGHIPARLTGAAQEFQEAAERLNLHYIPPSIPTDVDYSAIDAEQTVLVRGMGLNFFDLMIQVSQGRSGRFEPVPDAPAGQKLRYQPSGTEPKLVAGSRRGTPYRAKTAAAGFVPEGIQLRHFTKDAVARLLEVHGPLDFAEYLWPLIEADVQDTYRRIAGDGAPRFDIRSYARPFNTSSFSSSAEYQQAMLGWLQEDAAASAAGTGSPEKMALNAMHAARLQLKALITAGHIDPLSRITQVEAWFESLVEGLASGPPVQRIEELAALARAGIVEFLGPHPAFTVDEEASCFAADSPHVQGEPYRAAWLLEAMMPPNRVSVADSLLIHQLFEEGLARPGQAHITSTGDGGPRPGKGFDVTDQPHQLIGADGRPSEGLYALGLQLSSAQWGTAIAAEAGGDPATTARSLADADAAAADVLGSL
ncbi:FAD/NAD(P)-binding protein [Nesterenkonia massiliensis]|uniref:FAD/NAD(P)-binding protein n=1 Tax=Nesterenkonia massiliensis TaxID=1232429 RepID=A0ABT2HTK0_9MICC|nr:FAD/NAD(P)-binding protein [Nesterenkonia massiliensis]MCT1607819.1 FAD/NAD(P)-binding protein [Nesterenkonia massiliensis]